MQFIYYYLLIGSRIRAFHWYPKWWSWMTLNHVMADILRNFPQSGSFRGQLRCQTNTIYEKNAAQRFESSALFVIHRLWTCASLLFSSENWPTRSLHYFSCAPLCGHLSCTSTELLLVEYTTTQIYRQYELTVAIEEGSTYANSNCTFKSCLSLLYKISR